MKSHAATNPKSTNANRVDRKRLTPIQILLAAIGWLGSTAATLGLLLWLIGEVISDRFHWSQYLLWWPALAAVVFALVGLIAAFRPTRVASYRRWRLARWVGIFSALLIYYACVEHRLYRMAPAPRGLEIVHWNISPEDGEDADDPFAILFELQPDIAILTDGWLQPHAAAMRRWHEETGGQAVMSFPFTIFTTLPIQQTRRIVARDRYYVTQLVLVLDEQKNETLTIHAVDLPSDLKLSRVNMASRLRSLIDAAEGAEPDVAIGDFNVTRGFALNSIYPGYQHAFDEAGFGFSGTFPRRFPLAAIDHALIAPQHRIHRYEIIDPGLARHRLQRLHLSTP